MGHLIGWTEDASLPAPLKGDWDRETIVGRFKTEFELDHRFMLSLTRHWTSAESPIAASMNSSRSA